MKKKKQLPSAYADLAAQIKEIVETDCKDTHCFAVILEDDSMAPDYLKDDRVVFAPNSRVENGQAAIVKLKDGRLFFRYWYAVNGRVLLEGDHPDSSLDVDPSAVAFAYPAWALHRKATAKPMRTS